MWFILVPKNMIKFSVLLPIGPNLDWNTFNSAWKSIANQSLKPNEIIVVLDGLNESEIKKIKVLLFGYKNINIFSIKKQECLADVLNYGLNKCKYDYIARVDADDINHPKRFQTQINIIESKGIDIIASPMKYYIGKKEKIRNTSSFLKFIKYINPINHPTVVFNKNKILSLGGYPRFHRFEDYALWLNCLKNQYKFYITSDVLVYTEVDKNFFKRRSGWNYLIYEIRFQKYIYEKKHISSFVFLFNIINRSFIALVGIFLKPLIFKYIF